MQNAGLFCDGSADRQALAGSATDFADAEDASVYEKILEGLIHRLRCLPHIGWV